MPTQGEKSTEFVRVPGDPRAWAAFEFLFRTRDDFIQAFDPKAEHRGDGDDGQDYEKVHGPGHPARIGLVSTGASMAGESTIVPGIGVVFCPTRRRLPDNFPVRIMVRLGRRRPPLVLEGLVAYRQSARGAGRAGVGVALPASEQAKLSYILAPDANGPGAAKTRRRHERIPLSFPVRWHRDGEGGPGAVYSGILRDIGQGGAFVTTNGPSAVPPQDAGSIVIELEPPGSAREMLLTGRVAWVGENALCQGFGVEWRARDAGGSRLIRELVRRLTRA